MTTTLIRPVEITTPQITRLRGTLLDAATVVEGYSWQDVHSFGESYNCLVTDAVPTFPCPQSTLAAPVQSGPATQTTGGTLTAGTYRAKITAYNASGETVASNEVSQVTTGSASRITWSWGAVSGATGYRVYVTAVGGATGSEGFLIDAGNVTSYNWTGSPSPDSSRPVPTTNLATIEAAKTPQTAYNVNAGLRFGAYALLTCKGVPGPENEIVNRAEAERIFGYNEHKGVERALMTTRFAASGDPAWSAATDLTPAGGAVDPSVGLAILEGHAGSVYAGVPTIHSPRTIASLLAGRGAGFEWDGNTLRSRLGSKVAAGTGYEYPSVGPSGSTPAAGELWMYASGEVFVVKGDLVSQGQLSRINNDFVHLVERPYFASVDCYTAAVRVKVQ